MEGHSVERIYLRQRCSHGSRWIKPFENHASLQRRAPNTYTWDFPDVIKFRVAAHTISEKASGSGIRTIIRIGLKSWSVRPCPDTCRQAKFYPNPCTRFWVILLTDRQTDRHRGQSHLPPPLSEVNLSVDMWLITDQKHGMQLQIVKQKIQNYHSYRHTEMIIWHGKLVNWSCRLYTFLLQDATYSSNPSCVPNLKFLASMVAEINRGSQFFWMLP